jgi:ATP-binding cassette subfamily B protein
MTDNNKKESPNQKNRRRGGGGPGHGMPLGRPAEKAKDFKGTTLRLIKYLGKYQIQMVVVIIVTILVTLLAVVAPNYSRLILNTLQEIILNTISEDEGVAKITTYFLLVIGLYITFHFLIDYAPDG